MVIKAAAWQQHEGGLPAPDTNQLHQLVAATFVATPASIAPQGASRPFILPTGLADGLARAGLVALRG
jgi:hypothetical protein